MAIYHLSMKPIARSSGRSAVAAAAYRSGERLVNERDGLVHDFRAKSGIEHTEIVLPEGSNAEWARDRETLWNAAEFAEKRKDARVAREFEIALPNELLAEERLELTRNFAREIAERYKVAVDFAIHSPDDDTDVRNHHAHVMITTREVTEVGLGDKTLLERENRWLVDNSLPTSHQQLKTLRLEWEELANLHLAKAGHDVRIDHRSHQERGLSLEPTQHMGVHATQMDKRGLDVERQRVEAEAARRNAARIRQNPAVVLDMITNEKSVFDKRDMARTLHRYVNDDPQEFQALLTKVMVSDQLVQLTEPNAQTPAKYSTREMVELESGMIQSAMRMNDTGSHVTERSLVDAAISEQTRALVWAKLTDMKAEIQEKRLSREEVTERVRDVGLSDEQRYAIRHVTAGRQISAVVGYAGAGKSTMLIAAREAWEAQGYTVHGAALAGKAAEGLEESSGITSRTLASWEHGWKKGKGRLTSKDVFIIDEAGMIGSRQMAKFVEEARQSGAKLVLVGDHEQLQAIGAGAAFRSIVEHVGTAELQEVRRQRQDWQRDASVLFASHRTAEALEAYIRHGAVTMADTQDSARQKLVRDYVKDMEDNPNGSRLAMAHRRADVRLLNIDIRMALQESGKLPVSVRRAGNADTVEHVYDTNDGVRTFTKSDRLVFLENNRDMGVKNGMLGTVERTEQGRLSVRLDGGKGQVEIDPSKYKAFDHGYATTIHKTQGATVDRSFLLASNTMDRHLTYVGMTRHRDRASVYGGQDEFRDGATFMQKLSRSGAKETTLDYPREAAEWFARRRGVHRDAGDTARDIGLTGRYHGSERPERDLER
ncbi:Ti-type conjugative transfer relaxase TraA [Asticcacaulis sp. 201]|uniref:Ti-type conjugative transfer relaxase TraA n=1 Tax=Asticcacaulis sp. 201 TaxID=3028787 RepID=UPI002916685D|nr:Ti-type conjugative transfer relaxase TraA [Asticcacaulis sp. 201]MDV6333238.1 Ti-type conjugative transfer relaxase TraA [Asticcacaulis sp. 201]